jgi:hypothetical protein
MFIEGKRKRKGIAVGNTSVNQLIIVLPAPEVMIYVDVDGGALRGYLLKASAAALLVVTAGTLAQP